MAVPKKELGSKLSYQEVNEILTLYASSSEPTDPEPYDGQVWLHTGTGTAVLKRFNSSIAPDGDWEVIGEVTEENLLTLLTAVDGSGSGLDADLLDGEEGSFYQNASNLNSGTISSARLSAADILSLLTGVDGTGSGLDADKLDGIEGASFIRSDTGDTVSGSTEWQDNYYVMLGNDSDFRLVHNGTNSYMDNHTGQLNIRQLNHGANIVLQGENASGTMQNLLTLDPDVPKVDSVGAFISQMYYESIAANLGVFVTGIPEGATGIYIARDENSKRGIIGCLGLGSDTFAQLIHHDGVAPTHFSNVKDTGSKINIYYENGYVNIQNGFPTLTRTIRFGFFGISI